MLNRRIRLRLHPTHLSPPFLSNKTTYADAKMTFLANWLIHGLYYLITFMQKYLKWSLDCWKVLMWAKSTQVSEIKAVPSTIYFNIYGIMAGHYTEICLWTYLSWETGNAATESRFLFDQNRWSLVGGGWQTWWRDNQSEEWNMPLWGFSNLVSQYIT